MRTLLLTNLIAAFIVRFKWNLSKIGIHLTHLGLIIMLGGGIDALRTYKKTRIPSRIRPTMSIVAILIQLR